MANLIRKSKIHKLIDTDTCIRSSGEVIISGEEFYSRRQDIHVAKIVSIPDIFITKIEKHESLEFTTNKSTTLMQSAKFIITSPCQPSIKRTRLNLLCFLSIDRQQHPAATPLPLLTRLSMETILLNRQRKY